MAYGVAEVWFMIIDLNACQIDGWTTICRITIQIARLCVLITLLIIILIRRFYPRRRRSGSDEENEPLLAGSNQPRREQPMHSIDEADEGQTPGDQMGFREMWNAFKHILPFLWPKGKANLQLRFIGTFLLVCSQRVLGVLIALQDGYVINRLMKMEMPWSELCMVLFLRVLKFGCVILYDLFWMPITYWSIGRLLIEPHSKILDLSKDFHDAKESSKLWEGLNRGLGINSSFNRLITDIVPMLADLVLAPGLLLTTLGPYMGLLMTSIAIFYVWLNGEFLARTLQLQRKRNSMLGREKTVLHETTANWNTVSLFSRETDEKLRYSEAVHDSIDARRSVTYLGLGQYAVQSIVLLTGYIGVCLRAAYQISQGRLLLGRYLTCISFWDRFSGSLKSAPALFQSIASSLVDAENMVKLLEQQPSIVNSSTAERLCIEEGDVEFHNVEFKIKDQYILNKVSFRCPGGRTTAIVGASGGGKSTCLNMLFRFYDVTGGYIKIDGQDIRDVTLDSLRGTIGFVPQEPQFFNTTIRENIQYGNEYATEEDIYSACRDVGLHDKIMTFPKKYETVIGERGVKLSGGERQRLAIARLIIKNPQILLFDEATSAVDTETEAIIQRNISRLSAGRTVIVVAHRLSTVVNADSIIVIKNGVVVEQGSHEELLEQGGYYKKLCSQKTELQ
ncbi:uncharacterized protein TRUGW13939_08794 [Talaromyces rugulosus]|uniref:ABC transporter domain-containing protein n=1 Tax=Talaromyces rugulosus TaxID=121627 RepID=A0A7H8R5K4_TALRU|nr:uncharacterized protein TRUGW13939_08794 [Talaromyces rugulosus]QKX61642.1 hypothetical protein TRUGW13939_08794 [Talaromyces rugulosus]